MLGYFEMKTGSYSGSESDSIFDVDDSADGGDGGTARYHSRHLV